MAKDKPPAERQGCHFQFITTPTSDTPGTALLLFFNNRRYLFGQIAEGFQRACIQRGVGIKKVRNAFLTGPTRSENMGGLIGLILTMADVQADERDEITGKRPALSIHGGPRISHAIACARRFVFRTGMPLSIVEADPKDTRPLSEPNYSDENVNVWSLPIARRRNGAESPVPSNGRSASPNTVDREQALRQDTVTNMFDSDWRRDRLVESRFDEVKLPAVIWRRDPATKELSQVRCTTMADAPHLAADSKVLVRNPWPAALLAELPPADNISSSTSMCYIVKGHVQRGNFLPQKAKELGVKPGPVYARLAAGETITLENGTVVTPEMVLTPAEPGKGMAIFDVPSVDYLDSLSAKVEDLSKTEVLAGMETISWLLGPEVFHSAKFHELVRSLPQVKHFIASPDTCANYIAFDSSSASLLRLARIRPECFREPVHSNTLPGSADIGTSLRGIDFQTVERGLVIQIQPKTKVLVDEIPPFLDTGLERTSRDYSLEDLLPTPTPTKQESSTPYDDIEIITLGTGSAVPSKYRNVSASLLRIPGLGNYLIDCGENSLGQLKRVFTADELDDVLSDLRMIWISHLHADHHLGTISVIRARNEVLTRRGLPKSDMYLVSEQNMGDYIRDFGSVQPIENCVLLACLDSNMKLDGAPYSIQQTSLPIKEFATTQVAHCHGAQAVSITFDNGFKFSYSGDCRPSSKFAKIGADSDVLLHEATFDDGMEGDAMAKKHSTTGEALGVATQMRAKHVILTHFSQRYQKLPVLNNIKSDISFEEGNEQDDGPMDTSAEQNLSTMISEQQLKAPSNTSSALAEAASRLHTCVAFDLMRVKVHQIRDMHLYYPAIEKMFELELAKSEAHRQTLAKQNEARVSNKNKNAKNHQEGGKRTRSSSPPSGAGNGSERPQANLYEKINRTKPRHRASQSSLTNSAGGQTNANERGQSISASASAPKSMSNSETKAQQPSKKAQKAQNRSSQSHAQVPTQTPNQNQNHDSLATKPRAQPGPSPEAKRRKLNDDNKDVFVHHQD